MREIYRIHAAVIASFGRIGSGSAMAGMSPAAGLITAPIGITCGSHRIAQRRGATSLSIRKNFAGT